MKAEIITIGTEILIGSILNTNSKYLSEKLSEIGVHVNYQVSVRDDFKELSEQIEESINRSELVFLCGGLGPTEDDITKDALAHVLDKEIVIDEREYKHLLDFFNRIDREMSDNNIRQARVIKDSKILHNHWGIAPGEIVEYGKKKIFLFPGPPKEFEPMVDRYLVENIVENNDIVMKSLNVIGVGEAATEDRIRKLNINDEEISINTFAHFSETEIKIIIEGSNIDILNSKMNTVVNKLYDEFGKNIYSQGNLGASEALVKKLIKSNLRVSFAESITGGLLASKITSVPNASKVLKASYITYSNEAKYKELNVSLNTLEKFGAVSSNTAYEMAKGLYEKGYCNIAVSLTGEAGPVPSENEVGKTYICFYYGENNYIVKECLFTGDRKEIQDRASNYVISYLLLNINEGGK